MTINIVTWLRFLHCYSRLVFVGADQMDLNTGVVGVFNFLAQVPDAVTDPGVIAVAEMDFDYELHYFTSFLICARRPGH